MKKAIRISIISILQLINIGAYAQQLPDEWRLIKKTWIPPREGKSEWIYSYDVTGKITGIKYYKSKKLHSTQAAFVYDSQNRIRSYKESFTDGADTIQQLFSYDDQNRLISISEVKLKKSGKQTTLTRTFSYTSNEIKEKQVRSSFGGKLSDEITYMLDGNNLLRKTSIQDGRRSPDYIYGAYDNKPNPMIFTGAYFFTGLSSKQNSKEGYWEGDSPSKTSFIYTKNGMLQNAAITYTIDNRSYIHNYIYTYSRIKSASKPNK